MKLVYGTGNPAKLSTMQFILEGLDIQIIGLHAYLPHPPEVDESGRNPLENAIIKAKSYYQALGRPVFSVDSGLYIDGLAEEYQPGVHIRRPGDTYLTDEETIEYFISLVEKLGGEVTAQYRNAICLVLGKNQIYSSMDSALSSRPFLLTSIPHPDRNPGYPLDSLSKFIPSGAYYLDNRDHRRDLSYREAFRRWFCSVLRL